MSESTKRIRIGNAIAALDHHGGLAGTRNKPLAEQIRTLRQDLALLETEMAEDARHETVVAAEAPDGIGPYFAYSGPGS